ncbi:MAG: TMEM175 family protein [Candidatus Dormibacteria bacterium]
METARIEAFCDGVIAVAITLLSHDLRVPSVARGHLCEVARNRHVGIAKRLAANSGTKWHWDWRSRPPRRSQLQSAALSRRFPSGLGGLCPFDPTAELERAE